ncbi:MAG: hypothetical protein EOP92_14520 [Lysobacteraceae bacterium]|jgi:hypothetical protein|nr:MAG: hypothetical protein EOP92_14520 [Xanthomonadaceae bacterium]
MDPGLLAAAAFATSLASALALYAGSANCRWPGLRRWRGTGSWIGLALAGLSLWSWVLLLGGGAGLCAMLGTWMLAMMVLPWLGAASGAVPDARDAG